MNNVSAEQVMLARARPYALTARNQAIFRAEASKGCSRVIIPQPVALEPCFRPILHSQSWPGNEPLNDWMAELPCPEGELVRVRLWIATDQRAEWNRSELLLKFLSQVRHRCVMNIMGNQGQIIQQVVCHRDDFPVFRVAFSGQFEHSALSVVGDEDDLLQVPLSTWAQAEFIDCFPSGSYADLATRLEELKRTPYTTLFAAIAGVSLEGWAVYQVCFEPVSHEYDWKANMRVLTDIRYQEKLSGGFTGFERYAQQLPSGPLQQMAMDVESKAHNDKPLFATALRIAVINAGDAAQEQLRSLAAVTASVLHGGNPLTYLTAADYRCVVTAEAIRQMFTMGITYRPGFLLNSEELTTLAHIPPPDVFEHLKTVVCPLDVLPIPRKLQTGTPIGECVYAGEVIQVCIPDELRRTHGHIIGGTSTGKSTLNKNMVLHDIRCGCSVVVIDPHGKLIRDLLGLIPHEETDRVIYFDPGDPLWVPIWSPFDCGVRTGHGRVADDIVRALKSFLTGWGDRLEHLLRHAIYAILHLPGGNLRDVADLLRKKSPISRQIRSHLQNTLDNDMANTFWEEDFNEYKQADLTPPQHKLSKLLVSDTVSRMLSQERSMFNLRDVMDCGKVLLVDLSHLGSEERNVLGCLLLSLFHLTALGREENQAGEPHPCRIYVDEAHRFLTDAVEDLINEMRKFNVGLVLSHQQLAQMNSVKIDALASVGTTIIFRVIESDARHLARMLQGKIDPAVLESLDDYHAVARIGNHIVRMRTCCGETTPNEATRKMIIDRSHALYCRPASEVDQEIRARRAKWTRPADQPPASSPDAGQPETPGAGPAGPESSRDDGGESPYEVF